MLKRVLILTALLLLLALCASAGVDQTILGGEEAEGDFPTPGEMPIKNESTLYDPGHQTQQPGSPAGDLGPLGGSGLPTGDVGIPSDASAPVPEPATGLLLGLGVLGLARMIRRKAA